MQIDGAIISAMIGSACFVLAVITTVIGVSWRIRNLQRVLVEETMKHHVEAEHAKDANGRTLRERVILIETSIESIRRSIERVSNAPEKR